MTAAGGEFDGSDTGPVPETEPVIVPSGRPTMRPASGLRRRIFIELASVAFAILAVTAYVQFGPRHGDREASPPATTQAVHDLAPPVAEPVPAAAAQPEVAAVPRSCAEPPAAGGPGSREDRRRGDGAGCRQR